MKSVLTIPRNAHYFNYHAVPTNSSTLTAFLFHVTNLWRRTLRQRSQKDWTTWERIKRLADDWLPKPRILHPWPEVASPLDTQGGSRMPELGPYGSVRGARGNSRPYREKSLVGLLSSQQCSQWLFGEAAIAFANVR